MLTDGWTLPVSICEIRLADTPTLRASSRRLMPYASLVDRSRLPRTSAGLPSGVFLLDSCTITVPVLWVRTVASKNTNVRWAYTPVKWY